MHKNARTTKSCSQVAYTSLMMFIRPIIYSLYSIHCDCIVLNSTIVTSNFSQHFYDL